MKTFFEHRNKQVCKLMKSSAKVHSICDFKPSYQLLRAEFME